MSKKITPMLTTANTINPTTRKDFIRIFTLGLPGLTSSMLLAQESKVQAELNIKKTVDLMADLSIKYFPEIKNEIAEKSLGRVQFVGVDNISEFIVNSIKKFLDKNPNHDPILQAQYSMHCMLGNEGIYQKHTTLFGIRNNRPIYTLVFQTDLFENIPEVTAAEFNVFAFITLFHKEFELFKESLEKNEKYTTNIIEIRIQAMKKALKLLEQLQKDIEDKDMDLQENILKKHDIPPETWKTLPDLIKTQKEVIATLEKIKKQFESNSSNKLPSLPFILPRTQTDYTFLLKGYERLRVQMAI